ncbi:hypothetical protein GW17_00043610 [Ensete ventricosum]|nr:hypothetical protein GW17_00043610 [Ensete ventricosum]
MRGRREQSFLEEQQKGLVWVSGATECRPPVLENARGGVKGVLSAPSRSRPASPTHGIGLRTVRSVSGQLSALSLPTQAPIDPRGPIRDEVLFGKAGARNRSKPEMVDHDEEY